MRVTTAGKTARSSAAFSHEPPFKRGGAGKLAPAQPLLLKFETGRGHRLGPRLDGVLQACFLSVVGRTPGDEPGASGATPDPEGASPSSPGMRNPVP